MQVKHSKLLLILAIILLGIPSVLGAVPQCNSVANCRTLAEVYYNGTVNGALDAVEGIDGNGTLEDAGGATSTAGCAYVGDRGFNIDADAEYFSKTGNNDMWSVDPLNEYTVVAWVNASDLTDAVAIGGDRGIWDRAYIGISGTSQNQFQSGSAEANFGSVGANAWYYAAIVQYSNGTYASYINNTQQVNTAGATKASGTDPFTIGRFPGGAFSYWKGCVDEVVVFNRSLTETELTFMWNSGNGRSLSAVTVPPSPELVNISAVSPADGSQFSRNFISFNVSGNFSYQVNATLFINGTLNQSRNFSAGQNQIVNFSANFLTGRGYTYRIAVQQGVDNETTTTNTFYIDTVNPNMVTGSFFNDSIYYLGNITGQFNITDDFLIFSLNVSVDTQLISSYTNLNTTLFSYNLSYDVSNLSIGNHTLTIHFADGHTASELSGDYTYNNGLFNAYSRYRFPDGGEIKTVLKGGDLRDNWQSQRLIDRYTQTFQPYRKATTYTFVEESDQPIYVVHKPGAYNDFWIITGNHWKDYVLEDEPNARVSINQPSRNRVEVTISNLQRPELLKFNSIGDLNIVEHNFTFITTNATERHSSSIIELEEQTITFEINTTVAILSTDARLFYNSTEMAVTSTSFTGYDRHSSTFTTPILPTGTTSENRTFFWRYQINGTSQNESGEINFSQIVYTIGVDNCSTHQIRALNLTIRDETSDALLNGTIAGYFETYVSAVGNFTPHNISWTHHTENSPVGLCIYPNESRYLSYVQMEYASAGYKNKTYYFENVTLDNITETLNLYLTSGTTTVEFEVVDFNDDPIQNVLIHVLSYDLATNSFTTTEVLKTDFEGKALGEIVLNTQWYQFSLLKNGQTLLFTTPTKITTTTQKFRLSLESDYLDRYITVRGITGVVTFSNASQQFSLQYVDGSGLPSQYCLRIEEWTINSQTQLNETCVSSSSGTISIGVNTSGAEATYLGTGFVTFSDGQEFTIDSQTVSFGSLASQLGVSGILMTFFTVLTLILVGIWNPMVSVMLAMAAFIFAVILGIFALSWEAMVALVITGGIVLYKLSRR